MFVDVVKPGQIEEHTITSVPVRLERTDVFDKVRRGSDEAFIDFPIQTGIGVCGGELGAELRRTPVCDYCEICQVVQNGSKVMNRVSDDGGRLYRQLTINNRPYNDVLRIRIGLTNDSEWVLANERIAEMLQVVDVAICSGKSDFRTS